MSNKSTHNEDDSNDHSDCQDCRRQKKQNQALISIYQRLQNVHTKIGQTQQSIKLHQESSLDNRIKIKNLQKTVQNIKNTKNSQQEQQFQNVGYQLFAEMIQQQQKNKHFKQNQRLKKVLHQIYKEKEKGSQNVFNSNKNNSLNNNSLLSLSHNIEAFQKDSNQWFNQPCTPRQIQSGKFTQIFSTKSSFNMTKRKTVNFKQFEQLNLWLFENHNKKLQKQLYQPQPAMTKRYSNYSNHSNYSNYSNPNELFQTKSSMQNIQNQKSKSNRFTLINNNNSKLLKNTSFRSSSLHEKNKQISDNIKQSSKKLPSFNKQKLLINTQILNKEEQRQKSENYFSKRIKSNVRGSVLPAIERSMSKK